MSPVAARGREQGSATVLVLACGVLLSLAAAVLTSLAAVGVARHRAGTAADLAALAAASRALAGEPAACEEARAVASDVDAELRSCTVVGRTAEVEVEVRPPGRIGELGTARSRARAGPADVRP